MIIIKQLSFEDPVNWDGLIKESATATFFQTKEWMNLWHENFGGNPYIMGIYDGKQLIGIAPFSKNHNRLSLLGTDPVLNKELVTDYGDIIIKIGKEEAAWKEILKEIRSQKSEVSKAELNFIREDSPSFEILISMGLNAEEVDYSPYLDLPQSWDEYLVSLDRHNRHELKRKIRRLEEQNAFKVCNEGDPTDIEEFFRLMSMSSGNKEGFLTESMKIFFRGIVNEFWDKKQLSLCFLKFEGKNIAGTLSIIFRDCVYLYNSGYDPIYNKLSAGLTLKAFLIKHAIEKGRKRFDFLRGNEKYKYRLGGKERKLYKFVLNPIP